MWKVNTKVLITGKVLFGEFGHIICIDERRTLPYLVSIRDNVVLFFSKKELTPVPDGATQSQIQALRRICSR